MKEHVSKNSPPQQQLQNQRGSSLAPPAYGLSFVDNDSLHTKDNSGAEKKVTPVNQVAQLVRKIPVNKKAGTTKTKYDPDKFKDEADLEMAKFSDLPGGLKKREQFSWHHIVPQSHLTKSLAEQQQMIRFGPASQYRIDDPGNDYTDPNYQSDGTRTPFSADVEDQALSTEQGKTLDHAELARRLEELLNKPKHKDTKAKKEYADPNQWFIELNTLLDDSSLKTKLTQQEIAKLKSYQGVTTYHKDGEPQEISAVSWGALSKSKMKDDTLFDKLDQIIRSRLVHKDSDQQKIFFRGTQALDEVSKILFALRKPVVHVMIDEFIESVNRDPKITKTIHDHGKILLFLKTIKSLVNARNDAMKSLVQSQGLGGAMRGKDPHAYMEGTGEVRVNEKHSDAAGEIERNVLLHQGKAESTMHVNEVAARPTKASDTEITSKVSAQYLTEKELLVDTIDTIEAITKKLKDKYKEDPMSGVKGAKEGLTYIVTDDEIKSLRLTAGHGKKGAAIKSTQAQHLQNIQARQGGYDAFIESEAQSKMKELQAKAASKIRGPRVVRKFKLEQDILIQNFNEANQRLVQYYQVSGNSEAQQAVISMTNFHFLSSCLPAFRELLPALTDELGNLELPRPKSADQAAVDGAISTFVENSQPLLLKKLADLDAELKKGIAEQSAMLKSKTMHSPLEAEILKPALTKVDGGPLVDVPKPTTVGSVGSKELAATPATASISTPQEASRMTTIVAAVHKAKELLAKDQYALDSTSAGIIKKGNMKPAREMVRGTIGADAQQTGIHNLGNTCYLAAGLNALAFNYAHYFVPAGAAADEVVQITELRTAVHVILQKIIQGQLVDQADMQQLVSKMAARHVVGVLPVSSTASAKKEPETLITGQKAADKVVDKNAPAKEPAAEKPEVQSSAVKPVDKNIPAMKEVLPSDLSAGKEQTTAKTELQARIFAELQADTADIIFGKLLNMLNVDTSAESLTQSTKKDQVAGQPEIQLDDALVPRYSPLRHVNHMDLAFKVELDITNAADLGAALQNYKTPPGHILNYRFQRDGHAFESTGREETTFGNETPAVFTITLKRFEFNAATNSTQKNYKKVTMPESFALNGFEYHLRTVVYHKGEAGAGHYIASTKQAGQNWKLRDDKAVGTHESFLHDKDYGYIYTYAKGNAVAPGHGLTRLA